MVTHRPSAQNYGNTSPCVVCDSRSFVYSPWCDFSCCYCLSCSCFLLRPSGMWVVGNQLLTVSSGCRYLELTTHSVTSLVPFGSCGVFGSVWGAVLGSHWSVRFFYLWPHGKFVTMQSSGSTMGRKKKPRWVSWSNSTRTSRCRQG